MFRLARHVALICDDCSAIQRKQSQLVRQKGSAKAEAYADGDGDLDIPQRGHFEIHRELLTGCSRV
jgi:hypothetical protein